MYAFELPTTAPLSYADYLLSTQFSLEVSQATELRARLRDVLKGINAKAPAVSSSAEDDLDDEAASLDAHTQKDWMSVIQAIESYLPHLVAVHTCLRTDDILLRSEPVFAWRSVLSASLASSQLLSNVGSSKGRTAVTGVYYELVFVLLAYGMALCNLASSQVSALGSFESNRKQTISDEAMKGKDGTLKTSIESMTKATAVFDLVAQKLVPDWENEVGAGRLSASGRPLDTSKEILGALSRLAEAEASALSIRHLLTPTIIQQTTQQLKAPPLPKSHPSPSVLAKLHLNVVEKAENASSLCKTFSRKSSVAAEEVIDIHDIGTNGGTKAGKSSGGGAFKSLKNRFGGGSGGASSKDISNSPSTSSHSASNNGPSTDEVAGSLLKHLRRTATLHRCKAYRWLAIDAGEFREQYGEAIVYLRLARSTLDQLDEAGKIRNSVKSSKGDATRRHWRTEKETEQKDLDHWLASYQKLNDTVFFKPLPPVSAMQAKIPAGRSALTIKPFGLPLPAFGPGSLGYVSDGMRRLDLEGEGASNAPSKRGKETGDGYAGAGAYY